MKFDLFSIELALFSKEDDKTYEIVIGFINRNDLYMALFALSWSNRIFNWDFLFINGIFKYFKYH